MYSLSKVELTSLTLKGELLDWYSGGSTRFTVNITQTRSTRKVL